MNETLPSSHFSKRAGDQAPQPAFIDVNADSQSITVNASVGEVYAHCARFEDLPRFITSMRDVRKTEGAQVLHREQLVRALRFLQAEHVGVERAHEFGQQRPAEADGVDVPGGEANGTAPPPPRCPRLGLGHAR